MISRQELKYASVPAYNAPYPGDDYAYDVINNISYALIMYRQKYDGKRFKISLSNGEEIDFEIKPWNLPHLLGIDYITITSSYMKPLFHNILELCDDYKINSLVVLNRIIENADKVIANDEVNSMKILNYYKVMLKTSCFLNISSLKYYDFGVLSFNKEVYKNITDRHISAVSNKFIISKTEENLVPFSLMGLKYDDNFGVMVPETLIAPYDFSDYLYGQQLVLPLNLSIFSDGKSKNISATREDKIRILKFYKSLVSKYNTDTYINGIREVLPKTKTIK